MLRYQGSSPPKNIFEFTNYYGERTRIKSNATFLVHYRSWDPLPLDDGGPGFTYNFNSNNISSALPLHELNAPNPTAVHYYVQKLIELGDQSSWISSSSQDPFRVIPLHSAEKSTCGEWFMGDWLGNGNRYNIVEWEFANQYGDGFSNRAVFYEINNVGNAWFKYSCIKSQFGSFSLRTPSSSDPFSGIHDVFNCVVYLVPTNPIGLLEPEEYARVDLFPNPVLSSLTLTIDDFNPIDEYTIILSTLDGKMLVNGGIQSSVLELNLSELPTGIYVITVNNRNKPVRSEKVIKI